MTLPILLTISTLLNLFLFIQVVRLFRAVRNAVALLYQVAVGEAKISPDGSVTQLRKHA